MIKWLKSKIINRSPRFSKPIVVIVIFLNYWFANRVLDIFLEVEKEPGLLIGAWFGFTVGELFLLARLKIKGDESEKDGVKNEDKLEKEAVE